MQEYITHREFEGLKQHITDVISPIRDGVDKTERHLDKLNGQVAKNTAFRNKMTGGLTLLNVIVAGNMFGVIILIVKVFTK